MKTKHLVILNLIGLFFYLSAQAQYTSVPNGGFENWESDTLFEDLKNFQTSNLSNYLMGIEPNVQKMTGQSGYATKLSTTNYNGEIIFAFIANGNIYDSDETTVYFNGGQAYTGKPDSIKFDAIYNIREGDSAIVMVIFKKLGQVVSQSKFKIAGIHTGWNTKSYKLNPLTLDPDTMFVCVMSSDFFSGTEKIGSTISVDNFRFVGVNPSPILNGAMEDWEIKKIVAPVNWQTFNAVEFMGGKITATKTTDKANGQFALRVESYAFDAGDGFQSQRGFVFAGDSIDPNNYISSFPVTGTFTKMTVDLKYLPVVTKDTATIYCSFSKYDPIAQVSNFVGGAFFSLPNTVSTYTHFEVPIDLTDTPDSCTLVISAGSFAAPKNGSILFVDNLGFDNKVIGIENIYKLSNGKMYYQSNGKFTLESDLSASSDTRIDIMDMTGKTVYSNNFSNVPTGPNVLVFYVPNLSKGIYAYTIQSNGKLSSDKLFVY